MVKWFAIKIFEVDSQNPLKHTFVRAVLVPEEQVKELLGDE